MESFHKKLDMNTIFSEILEFGLRTHYRHGKYLFYRGDIGNDFYIIECGGVELSIYDMDGKKMILADLKEGDFFGHIEIFTNSIRSTNAYVSPGTRLISFTANTLREFLYTHNDKAIQIVASLCSVIDQGIEKIEDALVLNAYQKVSKKLYELSQANNSNNILVNQRKVSEFLALSERTTNISLQKLKNKGAIALRRSRIEILDYRLLKEEFSYSKKPEAA